MPTLDTDSVILTDHESGYLPCCAFGTYENVQIRRLDLNTFTAADLSGDRIDSVLCLNVFEHIEDDKFFLSELYLAIGLLIENEVFVCARGTWRI